MLHVQYASNLRYTAVQSKLSGNKKEGNYQCFTNSLKHYRRSDYHSVTCNILIIYRTEILYDYSD